MVRLKVVLLLGSLICLASGLISLNGCGGVKSGSSDPGKGSGKIQHVVIIFQENRTPDNLFHDQNLIIAGADIALQGKTSSGKTVTLQPVSLVTNYDLDHGHPAFVQAWNNGSMNGADLNICSPSQNCPTLPQYQYVKDPSVQPYFTMAETYTFGDRMFQTNQGPSFPAHQYIISGTSAVSAGSTINVADNPAGAPGDALCLAPPGATVLTINTSQPNPDTQEVVTDQLCYEHPTLTDLTDRFAGCEPA